MLEVFLTLKASDFDYPLAGELIAQHPLARRDQSRLMRLARSTGELSHHRFFELPGLLRAGDLLVLNDTRVIPARFVCRRRSGARIEGLFLREMELGQWEAMLKNAGRCSDGESLLLEGGDGIELQLKENLGEGRWRLGLCPVRPAVEVLERAGATPLPPYIRREAPGGDDPQRYQTTYAAVPGAVAAPTAGLHFSEDVFAALSGRGIEIARATLHVGLGTFSPVKCEQLDQHQMHSEWYELPACTAERLNDARRSGRRIVAVGTTSVRILESAARAMPGEAFAPQSGWTNLFLYPPAEFHAVDATITNFHLPRSTLLMLVAAFCSPGSTDGLTTILRAYGEAQRLGYRFFSYGDAMLIE